MTVPHLAPGVDHRVVLGDCLDPVTGLASLPDKSVDHVITDPPYEAEAHSKGRRANGGWGAEVKEISYPPIAESEREEASRQIARVCRGWALVFCQAEALNLWRVSLERGGAKHIRMGVYRKIGAQPQYSGDRPGVGWEAIEIAWCGSGRPGWNGGGRVAVWEAMREGRFGEESPHDGAKPLVLMEALVSDFTQPGDLVCDPFAGSGTTLVACKRLARRGIGWEREEATARKAQRRINSAREQLGLFRESGPEPKQAALLDVPRVRRGGGER